MHRLGELGFDHAAIAREVDNDRWQRLGTHTVALHTGPVSHEARRWRAVWEVAEGVALVDGVRVHRVTRRTGESSSGGLPRTRVEVAALRAAAWARSDRQAALILCMVVQQRLTTGERLLSAFATVRNRGRRPFVRQVLRDVADGAQSLGELDFTEMCRRHGVPEPERQVLRRTALGRVYLDVRWAGSRLVVEIDGSGHRVGLALTDDNLRQNEVSLGDDTVLRIDLIGLRVHEAAFMSQVLRGLARRAAA